MSGPIPAWSEGLLALLGIFGMLGGAAAYFSQSRAKNIIELQKEELQITKETNSRLQAEIVAKEHERAVMTERIAGLEKQVEMLQSMVTQAPEIKQLSREVVNRHTEVIGQLQKIATLLERARK